MKKNLRKCDYNECTVYYTLSQNCLIYNYFPHFISGGGCFNTQTTPALHLTNHTQTLKELAHQFKVKVKLRIGLAKFVVLLNSSNEK